MRAVAAAIVAAALVFAAAPLAAATATAVVGTGVENRTAVGAAERFPANVGSLTCVSEVVGGGGKVIHVWFHGDREVRAIDLPVKGGRYRTWSTKSIQPSLTGPWHVEVRAEDGTVLARADFTVE